MGGRVLRLLAIPQDLLCAQIPPDVLEPQEQCEPPDRLAVEHDTDKRHGQSRPAGRATTCVAVRIQASEKAKRREQRSRSRGTGGREFQGYEFVWEQREGWETRVIHGREGSYDGEGLRDCHGVFEDSGLSRTEL